MRREDDGAAGARRARATTYGLVAVLLVVAALQLEPWPLTSFRLFSERRTGERVAYVLVAIDAGGGRHRVHLVPDPRTVRAAQRQLPRLAALPAGEQRAKVRALLAQAEVDPTGFEPAGAVAVVVQRVERHLDPGGGPATEGRRVDLVRVALR